MYNPVYYIAIQLIQVIYNSSGVTYVHSVYCLMMKPSIFNDQLRHSKLGYTRVHILIHAYVCCGLEMAVDCEKQLSLIMICMSLL